MKLNFFAAHQDLGEVLRLNGDCLRRAGRAGVVWPLPEDVTDEALKRRLSPPSDAGPAYIRPTSARRPPRRRCRRPRLSVSAGKDTLRLPAAHKPKGPAGRDQSAWMERQRGFGQGWR